MVRTVAVNGMAAAYSRHARRAARRMNGS